MTAPSPVLVAFTRHAARRALERQIEFDSARDLVLTHHNQRRRNPGEADWLLRVRGEAITYNWHDGTDDLTALVISVWRE